jgi:NADH-quinone oxidoreductase subunit M
MLGVLSDRMHQDFFEDQDQKKLFGGIAGVAPYLSVACAVGVAGLLGIPGSGNFIGQSLIFFGSYHQNMSFLLIAICVHVFFSAILFRLYQSVFLGASVGVFQENFTDLSSRERGFIFSILSAILFFGIYPKFLVELIRPTILMVLTAVNP